MEIRAPFVRRQLVDQAERPWGRPVERVVGRVPDPRSAHVRVGVEHLDVACAQLVGDLRDRPCEREVIGVGRDAEQLPRLEVDADLDREAGIAGEALVRRHGGGAYYGEALVRSRLVHSAVVASLPCSSRITTTGKVTLLIVAGAVHRLGADHGDLDSEAEPGFSGHADRIPAGLGPVPRCAAGGRLLGHVHAGGREGGGSRDDDACRDDTDRDDAGRDDACRRHRAMPPRARRSSPLRVAAAATRSPTRARTEVSVPNLDEAKPPYDLVVDRVTNGKGVMPPFKGQLSEQQIQDVAAYVSSVAGKS